MSVVRSSFLLLNNANASKLDLLHAFMREYRGVVQKIIDHVWGHGCDIPGIVLNIPEGILNVPSFIPVAVLPVLDTTLSARAVKCASSQAMSMIKAAFVRRRKDQYWLTKIADGRIPKPLQQRLSRPLVKPNASGIKAELNSICARLSWETETSFDGWFEMFSLGKVYGKLYFPVKRHRHLNKLAGGKQLAGILVSETRIDVRFAKEPPARLECATQTVGGDTGLKSVLTLSDGQVTPFFDSDGYSLDTICERLARRKKGSKAFERTQTHRTNFINWTINQLNFGHIKELRLERVKNINYGRRAPRHMQAWTNSDIQRKVERLMEERNVSVKLQSPTYKSQRCSSCGNVRKANRKGKVYTCRRCGFIGDADLNAACNHAQNLSPIPDAFFRTKKNLGHGFLWTSSGCFTLSEAELAVPPSTEKAYA